MCILHTLCTQTHTHSFFNNYSFCLQGQQSEFWLEQRLLSCCWSNRNPVFMTHSPTTWHHDSSPLYACVCVCVREKTALVVMSFPGWELIMFFLRRVICRHADVQAGVAPATSALNLKTWSWIGHHVFSKSKHFLFDCFHLAHVLISLSIALIYCCSGWTCL